MITFRSNFLNFPCNPNMIWSCSVYWKKILISRRVEHYFSEMKRVANSELITCLVSAFRCIWFTSLNVSHDIVLYAHVFKFTVRHTTHCISYHSGLTSNLVLLSTIHDYAVSKNNHSCLNWSCTCLDLCRCPKKKGSALYMASFTCSIPMRTKKLGILPC